MLIHLLVRDLAVVDNAELELAAGMTVLTGETGAGKSLIVDALELAVGGRASADLVRAGSTAAEVVAVFEPAQDVQSWLEEQALDDEEGACVVRRVVGSDGRSRAFINARPVPVSQLRDLGERLVDVHGQHAHQALLNSRAQRELLDAFIAPRDARLEVASLHARIDALDAEIRGLDLGPEDPRARLDYLRFQIEELRAAPIEPERLSAIDQEHRRLANAAEILEELARASSSLDSDTGGASQNISTALRAIEDAARLAPGLDETTGLLRECTTLVTEAQASLRRYADGLQQDDGRLRELEQAMELIADLARKHRCNEHELHERLAALEQEAARIEAGAERLEQAAAQRAEALAAYRDAARRLHEERERAAGTLCAAANEVLATLGMKGARVAFRVQHDPEAAPSRHGTDQVSLLASTNPGQPALPLAKIASGGELSRIALAMHAVAVDEGGAATVVFDEVDVGVGGAVAEIVGRRMRELGQRRQVLAVTHQPQVAAVAHHHVAVRKEQDEHASHSRVMTLDGEAREQELARMLGGVNVTQRTLEHAREMLAAGKAAPSKGKRRRRPAA